MTPPHPMPAVAVTPAATANSPLGTTLGGAFIAGVSGE